MLQYSCKGSGVLLSLNTVSDCISAHKHHWVLTTISNRNTVSILCCVAGKPLFLFSLGEIQTSGLRCQKNEEKKKKFQAVVKSKHLWFPKKDMHIYIKLVPLMQIYINTYISTKVTSFNIRFAFTSEMLLDFILQDLTSQFHMHHSSNLLWQQKKSDKKKPWQGRH